MLANVYEMGYLEMFTRTNASALFCALPESCQPEVPFPRGSSPLIHVIVPEVVITFLVPFALRSPMFARSLTPPFQIFPPDARPQPSLDSVVVIV